MELTDVIGDFGPFQRRILFMLFMRGLVVAFFILITTVFIPPLKYHCASDYFQFQQNGSDHEQQCSYYDGNETVFCDRWEYESTDGKTTLNMEFDLVCDRKWLESLIHFIYFSGNFAAFIPGGYLADRYGRRRIALMGTLIMLLSLTASVFSPTYYFFLIMRFLSGCGTALMQNSSLLLFTESVGPRYRDYFTWSFLCGFGIGQMFIGLAYWTFWHWKHIQIACGVILALFMLVLAICIPESARWLLTVDRDDHAREVIENAAKMNKRLLVNKEIVFAELKHKIQQNKRSQETSLIDLLRDKGLRKIIALFYLTIMNTAFIYYFFHLNTANFEVALYLSVILLGVIQTLSTLVYLLMAKFLSRTRSIFINCCVAGLVFLSVVAIPSDERFLWAPLTLALIGNISLSLNFAFLWIIGAELLPTSVRNSGIDVGWALGRTTSMVAPFFVQLWSHTGLSPLIFVGIYSLAAGVIAFFLPETKDQNLMDTISEAKKHFLRANKEVAEEETPV